MCGLVGIYSSNFFMKHKQVLADMLYLDTWRGRDSTGVAAVRHNADTVTLKSTVPGYEFVEGPALENHLKLNDFCWIGHNRFGTVGKNTKSNAHPFEVLDEDGTCLLVGAHNGTLKNRFDLDNYAQYGTDSEALFHQIAHKGLEQTLSQVQGAWALTYYDHNEEQLRIIRNKERPLFYAFEEGRKTLIWASEMWMIRVACSRAGIKLEKDQVFSFAEDTLYSFPAPDKINDELTFERKGGLVGKQTVGFFQRHREWDGGTTGTRTQQETATQTRPPYRTAAAATSPAEIAQQAVINAQARTTAQTSNTQSGTKTPDSGKKLLKKNESSSEQPSNDKSGNTSNVTSITSAKTFKGYDGKKLTEAQLKEQLIGGCGWCESEFININDKFGWLAPSKPICSKCLEGTHEEEEQPSASVSVH